MLIIYIIVVGIVVGYVASLGKTGFPSVIYMSAAFLGALLGAFLSFGDSPSYLQYSFLNVWTIPVVFAIAFALSTMYAGRGGMKNIIIGIGIIGIIIGAAAYFIIQDSGGGTGDEFVDKIIVDNDFAVEHFKDELLLGVMDRIGQPIEGVDAFILMNAFPEFVAEDFEGVESLEGEYTADNGELLYTRTKDQPITSAEQTIAEDSYGLLLEHVSLRLGIEIENTQSVDAVLKALGGPEVGLDVPIEADFGTRVVYGTDATLDPGPLQADCRERNGTFNTCGSICAPDAELCAAVCAFTCENIEQ